MSRRLMAGLVAASLLVPTLAVSVHAATVQRLVSWYGGGSLALQATSAGQATITELGFALDSSSATTAEVIVHQDVYPVQPDGTWGDLSIERYADLVGVPVQMDLTRLSSASFSAGGDGVTWQSCDAQTWTCVDEPFSVSVAWTAVGPVLHDHQMSNELQVGLTRFGANSVGSYRFQTATVVLNGGQLGGSSPDGILPDLFQQTQGTTTMEFGAALPSNTTSSQSTLHANVSGLQAIANTSLETPGSYVSTGLIASDHATLPDGSVLDGAVLYSSTTQFVDDQGTFGDVVEVDGVGAGQVSIDRTLASASASATLPVTVCIYTADSQLPPACSTASVDVSGAWTATDKLTHSLLIGTSVVSGTWVYNIRQTTQSRVANAVVTVDGVDAGASVESSIVSGRLGVNSVQLSTH